MTKYSFQYNSYTPVGVADAASFTTLTYQAIQGGSATQVNQVSEVYIGGQATSSAPTAMLLARDSTVGVTPTALSTGVAANGPMDSASAALGAPAVGFITAATQPLRSNSVTLSRLNLSFNAFGGIVRWTAMDPGEYFKITGLSTLVGEVSLSAFNVGTPGLLGSHLVYETI
jgi:hypothetical protein